MIAALVLATFVLSGSPEVTAEWLRARHLGAKSLTADIVQTKEGKYWARPFTTHVRLRWTPGRVEWETLDPVRSTVVIEGDRIRVVGDGRDRDLGAVASDPRFAALIRFLRALAAFDLPALEEEFSLTWGARDITATPRPKSNLAMIRQVKLSFDGEGEIHLIEMSTATETTRIEFQRVERVR